MSSYKILIVDDMMVNLRILEKILQEADYETVSVSNGEDAILEAEKGGIQCILLDIVMPGLSGFEVIRRLKNIPAASEVPVIFITGQEGPESTVKGFELGAVDYITKPFHPLEVQARVKAHIKLFTTIQSLAMAQAETLKQIHEAQNSLLKKPADFPDAHFDVYYQSLHAAGGDIYDVIEIDENRVGYFVGDFAGHQISTSFLTSSIKALLKQNCTPISSAAESMRMVNSVMCELMQLGQYLTGCYAVIDKKKRELTTVNMGHPPLIFIPSIGKVREIGRGGDIMGAFPEPLYKEIVTPILPGDRIILYTDGLIEGKEVWSASISVLHDIVVEHSHLGKSDLLEVLLEETTEVRDVVDDDIMVLIAEMPGEPPTVTMEEVGKEIHYRFPAIKRLIDLCVQQIIRYISDVVTITDNYALQLVLYEALSNAVIHGNKENCEQYVEVSLRIDQKMVTLKVTDEGDGFNPQEKETTVVSQEAHSGRGIQLLDAYNFNYSYNSRGNTLYLRKAITDL